MTTPYRRVLARRQVHAGRAGASTCPASRRWCGSRSISIAPTAGAASARPRSSPAIAARPSAGSTRRSSGMATLLAEHDVVFSSGLNEDLGATAVFGSQMAELVPAAAVRRRARHVVRQGARAWTGPATCSSTPTTRAWARTAACSRWPATIPLSKSSTLPSHSEVALYDALMPTLYPGNVQEILDLGLHGFMLSRTSGLWVGVKIVTNVADETGTAEVAPERVEPDHPGRRARRQALPAPDQREPDPALRPRHGAHASPGAPRAGPALRVREQAQPHHGADAGRVARHRHQRQDLLRRAPGPRRARARRRRAAPLRDPHPQDGHAVPDGAAHRARVRARPARRSSSSRRSARSSRCSPRTSSTAGRTGRGWWASATRRTGRCCRRSASSTPTSSPAPSPGASPASVRIDSVEARIQHLDELKRRPQDAHPRPHRLLLLGLPAQPLHRGAGGQRGRRGHRLPRHGDGDGPRHHRGHPHGRRRARSGSASRRSPRRRTSSRTSATGRSSTRASSPSNYAVASGVNITYKILYNGAVAMTGGQNAAGALAIPALTPAARGRGRQADHHHHRRSRQVHGRLDRGRRRGLAPRPAARGAVAARGHPRRHRAHPRPALRGGEAAAAQARQAWSTRPRACSSTSGCARAAATAARSRTACPCSRSTPSSAGRPQIHQSSCNKDYSCLLGDCPSFLTVEAPGPRREEGAAAAAARRRAARARR